MRPALERYTNQSQTGPNPQIQTSGFHEKDIKTLTKFWQNNLWKD